MKILYILSTGLMGGVERHVHCLAKTINLLSEGRGDRSPISYKVSVRVLIIGELGPVGDAMVADGVDVIAFGCNSGHDWRMLPKMRQLLMGWQPDVVCMQGLIFLPALYFKLFDRRTPLIRSIHTCVKPSNKLTHYLWKWLGRRVDWHLPVSMATWKSFTEVYPWAIGKGEVFYNPLCVSALPAKVHKCEVDSKQHFIVGMAGRMADVKDWPSFIEVCRNIHLKMVNVEFWAIGDGPLFEDLKKLAEKKNVPICWLGQRNDAQSLIGNMDVLLLTSKNEQLPTVVLEAFGMHTAICGFVPDGGMQEILSFSDGPLNNVFVKRRDSNELAGRVLSLLQDERMRSDVVEDGWQILNKHFSAERLVLDKLLGTFQRLISQ